MSIQSEITLLNNTKEAIKDAIKSKGVMVASTDPFAIYPTRIGQISNQPGDKENLFKALVERTYTTLEVPYGTEVIRNFCFYDNDVVTSITLPETLKSIKKEAFYNCGNLTSITIPSNVTYIGEKAFQYCTSLTSITCLETVPATLAGTSIYVFDNTNNCPIYVPEDSVDAYKAAWTKYADRIQAIRVPAMKWVSPDGTYEISIACEDLATAGTLAQSDRTAADPGNLMGSGEGSAEIGDCVTTIGQSAFYNCIGLTSITIPDSVTTIGQNAFLGCAGLTSVTIPNSVTSIGDNAFHGCTSLTSVTVNSTTPPTFGSGVFYSTNDCPIIVPAASVDAYKAATGWSIYADRIIGEGVAYWTEQSYQCEVDETNTKTGMVTVVEKDTNPTSSTYNQTRQRTYEDLERCKPVSGFTKITSLDEATSGKYLIVDTANNIALNASLIKDTTSGSTGINAANNIIDVTIEGDTIAQDGNTLNAAADYDAVNHTLSWTDSDTGTTYYLYWPGGSTAIFGYSGKTYPESSMPYPMEAIYYQYFGSFGFANSEKLIAYNRTATRFRFYIPNNSSHYEANMALFKLN